MDPQRPGSGGQRFTEPEACNVCGGDGRLENAWGQVAKCPSCHGNGRRREDTGFRDVTKTKESHHRPTNKAAVAEKQTFPATPHGVILGKQVQESKLGEDVKAKLIREIIEYESSHGSCTQTFIKKIKKQIR